MSFSAQPIKDFWTPVRIQDPQISSRPKKLLIKIGEIADSYLTLSPLSIEWKVHQVNLDSETKKVWIQDFHLEKTSLKTSLLKIVKLFSFLLLALPALGIKVLYKYTYVHPFLTDLSRVDENEIAAPKRKEMIFILKNFNEWLSGHFCDQKETFLKVYQDLQGGQQASLTDETISKMSDEALREALKKMGDDFIRLSCQEKGGIGTLLRGLTFGAKNISLRTFVRDLMIRSWEKLCYERCQGFDAWNKAINDSIASSTFTSDSFECLWIALNKIPEGRFEEREKLEAQHLINVQLYPVLHLGLSGNKMFVFPPQGVKPTNPLLVR